MDEEPETTSFDEDADDDVARDDGEKGAVEEEERAPPRREEGGEEAGEEDRTSGRLDGGEAGESPDVNAAAAAGNGDRNPEPPSELVRRHLIDADNIGDTVFSKHKLFSTLMKLIETVDKRAEPNNGTVEPAINISDDLQDELCQIWDMSMNSEVVCLLREFKAVDILTGVISRSCAPRATEICTGILGNMACSADVRQEIAADSNLVELLLMLLESPDAPTLVETTRLLRACVSDEAVCSVWMAAIKRQTDVFKNICFILQSSTNDDLLRSCVELCDTLMDVDDALCGDWSTEQLVAATLEAVRQTGKKPSERFATFLHLLQLVSTTEPGVAALVAYTDDVSRLAVRFLMMTCSDDILVLAGRESVIASALSVLSAVLSASSLRCNELLAADFQLVRCLLKLLEAVGRRGTVRRGSLTVMTDLLQTILVVVISALHAASPPLQKNEDGGSDCESTDGGDARHESLRYLDSMCSRPRLRCLVQTLQTCDKRSVDAMSDIAARWRLQRLARIVSDSVK